MIELDKSLVNVYTSEAARKLGWSKEDIARVFEQEAKSLTASAIIRELRGATPITRRQALQSYTDDAVVPGRPFVPLKPMRPAKEGQRQVFSRFADYVESLDSWPEYVSAKRDGMRVTFHRHDGKVTAYSDDGKDTTSTLPELVKRLEAIKGSDFVLDSEVERWDDQGQHYPREAASGAIHSGEGTADLIANVFDVLYWDGQDLHKQPFVERMKVLNSLPADTKSDDALKPSKGLLNVIPHYPVKDRAELEKLCMKTAYKPGVEGVVVKRADGDYPLDGDPGEPPVWVKFHKSAAFNVVVLEAIETKVPGVFNFVYGIPAGDAKPAEPFELDGKTYMIIGKTFSSSEQHKVRDEIEVESETVNYTQNEDGTVEVSFWVPTIIKGDGEKYSPNQPRDEAGRFGSGGGSIPGNLPDRVEPIVSSATHLVEKSGSDLPNISAVPADEIPMVSSPYYEVVAAYKAPGDTLFINKDAEYWKLDPAKREADAKKAFRLHKLSTDREDHPVLHELGHRAQAKNSPSDWNADSWMSDAQMDIAYKVSSYSMNGKQEFVAEAYAGLVSGRKYPDDVMELYQKWGGLVPK